MPPEQLIVLAITVAAIVAFVSERVRSEVVAIAVLCSLALTGVLDTPSSLAGFANPAVVTVGAMFVLSAALERSGALAPVTRLFARVGRRPWLLRATIIPVAGLLSAFINNTAVVAMLVRPVIDAARAFRHAPSRFLIPLSYGAQFGGVCTLVGTSTNLLVHALAIEAGFEGFTLFEFTALGLAMLAIGTLYLVAFGAWLLPDRGDSTPGVLFPDQSSAVRATPDLLVEVMVPPGPAIAGHTAAMLALASRWSSRLLAIRRNERTITKDAEQVVLHTGDVLLFRTNEAGAARIASDRDAVVLNDAAGSPRSRRAFAAVAIVLAAVAVAALGFVPIWLAALVATVVVLAARVITADEAIEAIDWRVLILIAAMLPLGLAMQRTGLAAGAVTGLFTTLGVESPWVGLALVYLVTAILTEIMSNAAAAALLVPIAISIAAHFGVDAKPFLVTVAFAASTSFATPVGYQTNTMVYSAGNYRFGDFIRIGVPLNLLFFAAASFLIPRFFPLVPA